MISRAKRSAALPATARTSWKNYLHDGFSWPTANPLPVEECSADVRVIRFAFALGAISVHFTAPQVTAAPYARTSLEVVFHRDYKMDDGPFNNNGWMQELPDPITKMTWENAFLMSVKTAKEPGRLFRRTRKTIASRRRMAKITIGWPRSGRAGLGATRPGR